MSKVVETFADDDDCRDNFCDRCWGEGCPNCNDTGYLPDPDETTPPEAT